MEWIKKVFRVIADAIRLIIGIIAGYFGVVWNIIGTVFGIFATVLIICAIVGICMYTKFLPELTQAREVVFDKLVNMKEDDFVMKEDTVVYDSKNQEVGSVNAGSFEYVEIQKISSYIYDGYIAVEDKRFKTHAGVDLLATMRAGVALVKNNGEITQGGSTITQQVIKNNLLSQEQSFTRKIAEIILAPTVEQKFSKDKIMEFYCNSNYYGNRCYGVGAASKYYFGKKAADLEPEEAALLIGLSNSPSAYDPINHPKESLAKRNEILVKMHEENVLTDKEFKKAYKKDIKVLQITTEGKNESYVVSYAIHCAAEALMEKDGFPFQYTFKNGADYDDYNKRYNTVYSEKCNDIRSGGYKLYTSIDMKKQKRLQKAIDSGLAYSTEKNKDRTKYALQGAAVCVDNASNYVVAIVGGRGTKDSFNRGYLAARQSGSSIKPLIDYAPGFESGAYYPSTIVNDHKIKNGPKNAGGGYRGKVRIREAVARSLNTVAWQVLDTITPKYGLSFLDAMQFHYLSYVDNDNLALSLGGFTKGVRVVDMAKGYSTLANNGQFSDRTCIRKINHSTDGTIYKDAEQVTQVYNEEVAWMMTDVLKGVINEPYGTGRSLKLANGQIAAGKTGTTNSSKDAWFCGYTKYYTTVVWCGYDTPRAMPGVSGASLPGKIWKNYMDQIHKKKEVEDFVAPEGVVLARYDSKGNIVKGSEQREPLKRTSGKDFFSSTILREKKNYASKLHQAANSKSVLKLLKAFEELTINSMAEYYKFETDYSILRDRISAMTDDDLRTEYSTRAKDKYDSLHDERVSWKEVVKAYEKMRQEENAQIARENAEASKKAREKQTKSTRISLAKTRLKALRGYKYRPSNLEELLVKAKEAVEACKNYGEYASLSATYQKYRTELYLLPIRPENNDSPSNEPAVTTEEPSVTEPPITQEETQNNGAN